MKVSRDLEMDTKLILEVAKYSYKKSKASIKEIYKINKKYLFCLKIKVKSISEDISYLEKEKKF